MVRFAAPTGSPPRRPGAAQGPPPDAFAPAPSTHTPLYPAVSSPPPAQRILLVDDEPDILLAYRRLLERLLPNVIVDTAQRPADALEALVRQRFDLIISDFRMPDMDGIEFLARAHRFQPLARRMLLSAYMDADLERRLQQTAAADQFVSKAANVDTLITMIRRDLAPQPA